MTSQHVFIDPDTEQFKAFAGQEHDGPLWMLNLIRLKETASYDDGREATGEQAYKVYGKESAPFFTGVGGKIVFSGAPRANLIGPSDAGWDLVFVAAYPDKAAFLAMVKDPGYQAIVYHRQAAVADSRLVPLTPGEEGRLFG